MKLILAMILAFAAFPALAADGRDEVDPCSRWNETRDSPKFVCNSKPSCVWDDVKGCITKPKPPSR